MRADNSETSRAHPRRHTTVLRQPPRGVELDEAISPLIEACWQHGLATRYCCEGQPGAQGTEHLAYICFASRLEALIFLAAAGPATWLPRGFRHQLWRRWQGPPELGWELDGTAVRFPHEDIAAALQAVQSWGFTLADLAAGAAAGESRPPRRCPVCGLVISAAKRADAVYCSRQCQLRGRRTPLGEGDGKETR